jgi:hypothetical protein
MSSVQKVWAKRPGSGSQLFAFERNGRVGFINPAGKVVIKATIDSKIERVGDFSDGRARIDKGYIDETGMLVIEGNYSSLDDFSDGLAYVMTTGGESGLFLDSSGNVQATIPRFRASEFSEGLAAYQAEGKPGLRSFKPGNFQYRDYPGLRGFINRTGNIVIRPVFADVGPFVGGLARAALDGNCHLVMPDGDRQGTPTTGYPSSCGGAPADAELACAVGFINRTGSFTIEPRFESALDFQEELAAVRVGGLWGFTGTDGTLVIPARFERAQSFREGLAAVKLNHQWGFIDRTGRFSIRPQFEEVEAFSDSLAIAYKGGRPFYIDRRGQTTINGPFREATPFVHGLAAVLLTDEHVAYINKSGVTVFDYFRTK